MHDLPVDLLKAWFEEEKRDLPWRGNLCPYAVWISEIMLQQTQVSVVMGYFQRWMERFPTVEALAAATSHEVIKMWEGLGYYSRARRLHQAAQYLVERHEGKLPERSEELQKIPGLGPYTVGAILSFAFHKKAAAVDGNVMRVLSRYFALEEDIAKASTRKKLEELTLRVLPEEEPWVAMEALIELGAVVCKKSPECIRCPLQEGCLAVRCGKEKELPIKTDLAKSIPITRYVGIIRYGREVLVCKGQPGKVMADLYEFPYIQHKKLKKEAVESLLVMGFGMDLEWIEALPSVKHTFTRYRAELHPSVWTASARVDVPHYVWVPFEELVSLPFSSGHRRILKELT